ncbi:MAG: phage tail length tape measure family protein, partial [Rhizobium sp.]
MGDNADDLIISISADQATLRRSVQRIEQTLDGLYGSVTRKFSAVGKAIDDSVSTSMQNRINAMVGIGTRSAKEWTGVLADQGKELERLRAKYSPLFSVINQYKTNVEGIRRAHALGAISSAEYQAAMSKERQSALASTAAIKGRNAALAQIPAGANRQTVSGFQTANIAAQFQDVAVTSAMGMNPLQIGLQQGTQLAGVLQTLGEGRSVVAALGAAFTSLISPVSLVTIGLTAGAAALIQYFTSSGDEAKSLDDALKSNEESIKRIAEAYGGVAAAAAKAGTAQSKALANAIGNQSAASLNVATRKEASKYFDTLGTSRTRVRGGGDFAVDSEYAPIADAIIKLRDEVKKGKGDFEAFYAAIEQNPNLSTEVKDKIIAESDALKTAADSAKEYQRIRAALFNDVGPNGMLLSQGTTNANDMGNYDAFLQQQRIQAQRQKQAYDAQVAGINAETPEQRAAAARAQAAAQYNNDETPAQRRSRINDAGNLEMERANAEARKKAESEREAAATKAANAADALKKKQDDLLRTAGDRIASVQLETSLLGKYGVAADNARFSLETWQKAEKLNLSDDQKKALQDKITLYSTLSEALAK